VAVSISAWVEIKLARPLELPNQGLGLAAVIPYQVDHSKDRKQRVLSIAEEIFISRI
jgi:hypothetical protein